MAALAALASASSPIASRRSSSNASASELHPPVATTSAVDAFDVFAVAVRCLVMIVSTVAC
jgi:hypothetical protein